MRKSIGLLILLVLLLSLSARLFPAAADDKKEEPKAPKIPKIPEKIKLPTVPVGLMDERKRIFFIVGGGYTKERIEGMSAELGAEVRLFGRVHLRLMVDTYHNAGDYFENGEYVESAMGANLLAVYKIPLSDTLKLYFNFGGMYTKLKSTMSLLGVTYRDTGYYHGLVGGLGFQFQLSNKWYLYFSGTVKYIMPDEPWTWYRIGTGFMYRIH